jgi:hypothetical protein
VFRLLFPYDTNSTGSYTSQGSQCLDYYFPKDKSGDRDYSYFDPPGPTAQDYGEMWSDPSNSLGGSDSESEGSSGSGQEEMDPEVQKELDKTEDMINYFNEKQFWNCPPGDIDCMIYGFNAPPGQ